MGVHRWLHAKGIKELQVLERVHDVVFAADDVGDFHLDIVHHVHKVEDVGAIRALHYHVRGVVLVVVVHRDIAADHIVQGHHALALEAETPYGAFAGTGDFIAFLIAFVGGGAFVYAAHVHELLEVAVVDILALALEVGGIVAAFAFAFIPIKPQPAHTGEDSFHGIFNVAFLVGVFDAEHESATHLAGEKVVEKGGTGTTDVQVAGGRGGKACAYGRRHARLIHLFR